MCSPHRTTAEGPSKQVKANEKGKGVIIKLVQGRNYVWIKDPRLLNYLHFQLQLKNNRIQVLEETPEVREQNPSTTPPDPVHGLQRRRGYLFNFTFTVRIRL